MKDGKLSDSGKEEEGKTFHKLHALGMNDDMWDGFRGVGSDTWKGCEWVKLQVLTCKRCEWFYIGRNSMVAMARARYSIYGFSKRA